MLSRLHGRQARPASAGWNLAKTLFQTLVFWTVFLALLPAVVYWLETRLGLGDWRFAGETGRVAGGVLFALGGSLGLASGITMAVRGQGTPLPLDAPRQIVVSGPYRFIRNPMAVAGLAQGVAVGLFLGSPAVILYALTGGPAWNYLVRPWEERDLERSFGRAYVQYRKAVHCWWPRWSPYDPASDATTGQSRPPVSEREQT